MIDHTGLNVSDFAKSKAFYLKALAPLGCQVIKELPENLAPAGGRDNGPPGVRAHYHPTYYGAFVLDPDGHNVEAVCHQRP